MRYIDIEKFLQESFRLSEDVEHKSIDLYMDREIIREFEQEDFPSNESIWTYASEEGTIVPTKEYVYKIIDDNGRIISYDEFLNRVRRSDETGSGDIYIRLVEK